MNTEQIIGYSKISVVVAAVIAVPPLIFGGAASAFFGPEAGLAVGGFVAGIMLSFCVGVWASA